MSDLLFTDSTHGKGKAPYEDMTGIKAFIGPLPAYPPNVIRESLEFADPEWQRRWDAYSPEQRAAYLRVVKERLGL